MEELGALMIGGSILGGGASAIKDNLNIKNECDELNKVQQKLVDTKNKWNTILKQEGQIEAALKQWQDQLRQTTSALKYVTKAAHSKSQKQQRILSICSIGLICVILVLLVLKRLDIFNKIYSLFDATKN
jgi:chromosome segregation ATPase